MNKTTIKNNAIWLTGIFGLSADASAIERPNALDEKRLPAEVVQASKQKLKAIIEERQAWLGVGGDSLHEDLAWHLGVKGGIQLHHVINKSPAAEAGLQPGDIITSCSGKKVLSQEDLRDAILEYEPASEVVLGVIQKGQLVEMKITLGERMKAAQQVVPPVRKAQRVHPFKNNDQLHDIVQRAQGRLHPDFLKRVERLQKQMGDDLLGGDLQHLLDGLQQDGGIQNLDLALKSSGSFIFQDDEGTIELKSNDGHQNLLIRDLDGEILFEGPYNTEEQKSALPEDLHQRLDDSGIGTKNQRIFKFQLDSRDDR